MLLFRQSGFFRLAAGAVILLFILTTYLLHRNPDFVNWKSGTRLPDLGQNTSHELSHTGIKAELFYNAHKLPTADDFLPHLKAVIQLPKLTVAEAKASCTWSGDEEIDFQYGDEIEWAVEDRSDEDIELHREQWQDFINHELLPYSAYKNRFEGHGIVIVGGNGKSLNRIRVILRQLKHLGSQLPVELHYWGDELPLDAQNELSSMWPKMYFNDLSAPSNIVKSSSDNFFHVNYQLKTAAVMNSRFAETLLLDSDNVPVMDPESLFESDTYKEYGTLFWPDIARTRPNNPAWAITNTQCRMDEYEQESGQLLIDKRKYFYHLQLAAWFNNVQTSYYMEFLLGDKDLFRFAWHALKTKYGFPPKWITRCVHLSHCVMISSLKGINYTNTKAHTASEHLHLMVTTAAILSHSITQMGV